MTNDIYNAGIGEFSVSKQFDILTYANRLSPLRGMTAESVTNSKIGNIIVCSTNGLMYGVGEDPLNPGVSGKLWQRSGYGGSDLWQSVPTNNQLSGVVYNPALLVDWRDAGNTKTIIWAGANQLTASDPLGATGVTNQALTFTSIGQGFVHPADKILYFPYNTTTNCLIGAITTNASPFGSFNATALTLPKQYRVYGLCSYGNYLAIPATTSNPASVSASRVFFWNRDTTQTWDYDVSWGGGLLQVLNNLNGTLVGISANSGNGASGAVQDRASISIKGYEGGEVFPIFEIAANHLTSAGFPSVTINPNVNFVKNNRLYFSVNIVPSDGISNSYYGLWSVGKNNEGRWTVTIERVATNDNSETGVLAAAIAGDFVCMVHTAEGTLTYTINGQTAPVTYAATSVYESSVNPEMPSIDKPQEKNLVAVAMHFLPLPTGSQVVMKVRVDSNSMADWKTIFTKTPTTPDTKSTIYETQIITAMTVPDGRNIEFRLESTGGAQITGFTYKYAPKTTNILNSK